MSCSPTADVDMGGDKLIETIFDMRAENRIDLNESNIDEVIEAMRESTVDVLNAAKQLHCRDVESFISPTTEDTISSIKQREGVLAALRHDTEMRVETLDVLDSMILKIREAVEMRESAMEMHNTAAEMREGLSHDEFLAREVLSHEEFLAHRHVNRAPRVSYVKLTSTLDLPASAAGIEGRVGSSNKKPRAETPPSDTNALTETPPHSTKKHRSSYTS